MAPTWGCSRLRHYTEHYVFFLQVLWPSDPLNNSFASHYLWGHGIRETKLPYVCVGYIYTETYIYSRTETRQDILYKYFILIKIWIKLIIKSKIWLASFWGPVFLPPTRFCCSYKVFLLFYDVFFFLNWFNFLSYFARSTIYFHRYNIILKKNKI